MKPKTIEKNIKTLPSDFFDTVGTKHINPGPLAIISTDISLMHEKFKVHDVVEKMDKEKLLDYLKFRFKMIQEEVTEGTDAIEARDPEEVVDAIIDMIVFGVGTLDAMKVDFDEAWNKVHIANMEKEPGVKEGRKNLFNFPDLIKPDGWIGPNHSGNHGLIGDLFNDD